MTETPPLPSDTELRILRVLWLHGRTSVREIHGHLQPEWPVGYTTVLKSLQRMLEKGLVTRSQDGRAHIYEPVMSEERTQRRLAGALLEKAFGGSVLRLVESALPMGRAREKELAEIRRMLDEIDE